MVDGQKLSSFAAGGGILQRVNEAGENTPVKSACICRHHQHHHSPEDERNQCTIV